MNPASTPPTAATRISLACVPCRNRHVRCDGETPTCARCRDENTQCTWQKSRRGGRPRTKKRPNSESFGATDDNSSGGGGSGGTGSGVTAIRPARHVPLTTSLTSAATGTTGMTGITTATAGPGPSGRSRFPSLAASYGTTATTSASSSANFDTTPDVSMDPPLAKRSGYNFRQQQQQQQQHRHRHQHGSPDLRPAMGSQANVRDILLSLYYTYGHPSQPCCLPRRHLEIRIEQDPPGMQLLLLVMQLTGSFFAPDIPTDPLANEVRAMLGDNPTCLGPWEVQALIIYSGVVFWNEGQVRSAGFFRLATSEAIRLGMHLEEFSVSHSDGDPVLAESWRRTWWQLYVSDVHTSAIKHLPVSMTSLQNVMPTVLLPCEEAEYESGVIPMPKSIDSYETREFCLTDDCHFSSFAHLIGLTRGFDRYVLGHQRTTDLESKTVCTNADSVVSSWLSLLPHAKREMFDEDGTFDESIFKANVLIQVYTVDIHRSLSKLYYNPIEGVSECAPPPPVDHIAPVYQQEIPTHTNKILRALDEMSRLLTLSPNLKTHTSFTICMISTTTIAYLSACRHVLRGPRLEVARERIRAAIGALRTLADVWPRGWVELKAVKIVANELLLNDPNRLSGIAAGSGARAGMDPGRHVCAGCGGDGGSSMEHSHIGRSGGSMTGGSTGAGPGGETDSDIIESFGLPFDANSEWLFGLPPSMPMAGHQQHQQQQQQQQQQHSSSGPGSTGEASHHLISSSRA